MSRKDYQAIAAILATTTERENIARSLADYFASTNPRFNQGLFLEAARTPKGSK